MKRSKKSSVIKLGLVQTTCSEDPAENLSKTLRRVEEAAKKGAQIICTQELSRAQYFCQSDGHDYSKLAEPIPGRGTRACQKVPRTHGVDIIASLFEKRAPALYHKTAGVIDADRAVLGRYRKMHIPDDPLYYEKFYYTP